MSLEQYTNANSLALPSKEGRLAKAIALLSIVVLLLLLMIIVGTLGFRYLFDMPWFDAFFNAAITTSTLGLETIERTKSQKIFVAIYALLAGIVYLAITSAVVSYILVLYLDPATG